MTRVEVTWEDVYTMGGWHSRDVEIEPVLVKQVGYILRKTAKHLILVSAFHPDEVSDVTSIPRSLVRKVVRI